MWEEGTAFQPCRRSRFWSQAAGMVAGPLERAWRRETVRFEVMKVADVMLHVFYHTQK